MLTTSIPMSAAFRKAARSTASLAEPHHWEILSATRLTLGAIPLMPLPSSAAAMRPPIQLPWPCQSVSAGPPNSLARSSSETSPRGVLLLEAGEVDHLLDLGGELAVGVVEAGVGHPDGHLGAAGGGLPALGQADAAVVAQQALVVPGRVGVDPGRAGGRRRLGHEPGGAAQAGASRLGAPTSAASLSNRLRATPRVRRSAARLARVDDGALTTMVLSCRRSRTTRAPSLTALAR